jgi:hypothetical protein
MSDNWIALIPDDPTFVPAAMDQLRAKARFAEIAPDTTEIELTPAWDNSRPPR